MDAAVRDETEQVHVAAPSKAAFSAGFSKKEPSAIARLTRCRSWSSTRPEPIVRWPTSELPICPGGRPTASPEALIVVCGYSAQSRSKTGVSASSTAFPGPGGAQPQPSRMTRTTGWRRSGTRRERFHVQRGAADERAVDALLREQLLGVLGLDRAAVEHRHVEQALDERVRLARLLGRRGLAGADRPDRLVGDHQPLVRAGRLGNRLDLEPQHEHHLPGLALLERLADAGDHAQPVPERGAGRRAMSRRSRRSTAAAPSGRRSRRDAELGQHRRRDFAGEGALVGPVHVLGEDRVPLSTAAGERDEGRAEHGLDALGRPRTPAEPRVSPAP